MGQELERREEWVRCPDGRGSHRMVYSEWGPRDHPRVLVCVHGLTRNGRDFDDLARALAADYRVVCPDVAGRGRSDRLADPAAYGMPQYLADMLVLLARLKVDQVDWLGTSMGGLIGMGLAALTDTPVRRLILNDVGPVITRAALERIASYVGEDRRWDSREEASRYFRRICAPFGALSEAQWQHLERHSLVQEAGGWRLHHDPAIGEPFRGNYLASEVELWPLYEAISCPVLALRGADSDLLTREAWQAMGTRGPRASLLEVPQVGHAPMLMDDSQIQPVRDWLLA